MKKTNDLPYPAFFPETCQTTKAKLFSKDEMNAIWEYLEQSGTLRDRCLYAFMMSGMRASDYLEATPEISNRVSGCLRVVHTQRPCTNISSLKN